MPTWIRSIVPSRLMKMLVGTPGIRYNLSATAPSLSKRIGKVILNSLAKVSTSGKESEYVRFRPRIIRPSALWDSYDRTNSGISSRQGRHQVAQKLINTGWPRNCERLTSVPSSVISVKSGACLPMRGDDAKTFCCELRSSGKTSRATITPIAKAVAVSMTNIAHFCNRIRKTGESISLPFKLSHGAPGSGNALGTLDTQYTLTHQSKSNIADQVGLVIDGYKYRDVLGFGRRNCDWKVNGSNDKSRIWNSLTTPIHSSVNRLRSYKSTR